MPADLSIIVPAFEERDRLGVSLSKVLKYVSALPTITEIIVVDDGSADDTEKIAGDAVAGFPQIESRVVRYERNRGKGFAVRTGLLAATANTALFTDADLSTPIEEMHKLIDPIAVDSMDVTFGSRALDRTLIGNHQPWRREQGGKVFNLIVRMLTGLPYWDTQCGFKAFNMSRFRELLPLMRIERFGFDVEFLYVANLHGLKLKEIPVRWNDDSRSKVSAMRDSIRMFEEVRQIRRNARLGRYELLPAGENLSPLAGKE